MKRDPFLDINPAYSDFGLLIALEVLNKATPLERLEKMEQLVLAAAQAHNDEACLELLKLLGKAYEFAAYDLAGSEITKVKPYEQERRALEWAGEKLFEKLRELYWKLPDKKRADRDSGDKFEATLINSKQWILKEASLRWADELKPQSVAAFRFLCEACRSPERASSIKEQENILQIVQEKTGRWFKVEHLEKWLKEPDVPRPIQEKLAIARARNGGPELVQRDIKNSEFLKCFKLEERSPTAVRLAQETLEKILTLDSQIALLVKNMQKGWGLSWDKIGESEYVPGKIEIVIGTLRDISLVVKLPEDCSEELGRDIYGRARRHVEGWWQKERGKDINISVIVEGGKANLKLPIFCPAVP